MTPRWLKAFQYDMVCYCVKLPSGAIRNYKPEIMYKAFAIAGYDPAALERFPFKANR